MRKITKSDFEKIIGTSICGFCIEKLGGKTIIPTVTGLLSAERPRSLCDLAVSF
ncbi:MAG: hypothetical protein NC452_16420 [Eubacterium sp.]|nr:hypothetical protein [Eubacterium sp.]